MKTVEERFWSKVGKPNEFGCRLWEAGKGKLGYGAFRESTHVLKSTHRKAYELYHGSVPEGRHVLHTCEGFYAPGDVSYRLCCAKEHLYAGTDQDNAADRVRTGRASGGSLPGASNPHARFSEEDVFRIRLLLAGGATQGNVAKTFGCSRTAINAIHTGQNWAGKKHV
jgi:hypothetical protein